MHSLERYRKDFNDNRPSEETLARIREKGFFSALDRSRIGQVEKPFTIDLWNEGTVDQQKNNRCWMISSLNPLRRNAERKLHLKEKNFLLSTNYIFFYDQLERSQRFLDAIVSVEDPEELADKLREPIEDCGQWYIFAPLADKYGVVPLSVMPDTQCSPDPLATERILNQYLRRCTKVLRDDTPKEKVEEKKEEMLSCVYGYLARLLGEPPLAFDFSYETEEGEVRKLENITPQQFFREICGGHNEDYVVLINHPSKKWPYGKAYSERKDCRRGYDTMVNVDAETMMACTLSMLKAGEMVTFGADMRQMANLKNAVMADDLYDIKGTFGLDVKMTKEDRITYKDTKATHLMTFDGVELDEEGRPVRWKVLNSRGDNLLGGHLSMSNSWFEQYVLSVVIRKDLCPDEIRKSLTQPPVFMPKSERY